ncbi:uncharacterized protein LOC143423853 [Xylocopa sonorina]|uniref:uncharacterized protein LOC143423853 n=1 Tax=Xylocopa sonorina TaxID=1818115 RepID=UPI00403B2A03
MEVYFLTDNRVFGKQNVPIWAEVTGYQIQLDPPCVDLGIVMIDSDVCQQIFNVINTGSSTVEVIIKTPGCLRRQISVYPKSTVLQPGIPRKITVRLMPESSIVANAKRYYNPSLNMLEFPIQVEILSQEPEKPPASIAKILASLTACHGLIIEPTNIDLGHVYTHESISTELTLTNQSLLTQKYAFPLLPSSMDIHPNHGVGAILPGETIRLHLIYSPCLTDIPGNEIGANGFSGAQSFLVRVATLAELAGRKKRMELKKLKDYLNAQSTNRRRLVGLKRRQEISKTADTGLGQGDESETEKMIKYEQEKKKQLKLRQQRMISIVKSVMQEMNNGTRWLKKSSDGRSKKIELEITEESLAEISLEKISNEKSATQKGTSKYSTIIMPNVPKLLRQDNDMTRSDLTSEETERITAENKYVVVEKEGITSESIMLKESKSSIEQVFPEDTCFLAIPSIVTFNDFEANKSYCRKLLVKNKTAKWAYLRFHKVHTEVWEPGVVEIDVTNAARVKPGLDASFNVKFSAMHEEVVTADIRFLTLNSKDTKTLHQFCVPVRCTPRTAMPVIDPTELRCNLSYSESHFVTKNLLQTR